MRDKLRSKLAKLVNPKEEDEVIVIDGEATDIDTALELKEPSDAG